MSRACLCWDEETYSIECCDDDNYHAQGIGSTEDGSNDIVITVDENGDEIDRKEL